MVFGDFCQFLFLLLLFFIGSSLWFLVILGDSLWFLVVLGGSLR